jgi:hypothetical protein
MLAAVVTVRVRTRTALASLDGTSPPELEDGGAPTFLEGEQAMLEEP